MGALSYLFFTRLKNQLKQFLRKPSKLIFMLIAVLAVAVTLIPAGMEDGVGHYRSMEEFYAIVAVLYAAVFITTAKNGFSNGASFFSMADVNLIFVSPLKASGALFFGMLQQLGKSLTLGLFLLFQYTLAHERYGIDYSVLIFVALGYGITALFGQMTATLIYIAVGSSDKKTTVGKGIFYSVIGAFVLYEAIKHGVIHSFSIDTLISAVRDSFMYLFPVSGFVTLAVEGVCSEETVKLVIGLGAGVVFSLAYYFILSFAKGDFYEDVLTAAEVSFSAVTSAKEGKTAELTPKNIRIGKTGINKGYGASAIRYKHKTENRRSRVLIFSGVTLFVTAMLSAYCFVIPSTVAIFVTSVYTLTITVSLGRWSKELTQPYIYLIPEKPFKKLLNTISEQIPSLITECIICFIPVHFILHLSFAQTLSMMAARIGFGFLFIGANLLLQRLFGKAQRTVISIVIYLLIVTAFSVPAMVGAFLISFMAPFNPEFGYFLTVPINLVAALILLFLSRNVLQYSEYNYR